MSLIFVDCEAYGNTPRMGRLTEIGAVEYETLETFYAELQPGFDPVKHQERPVELSEQDYWTRMADEFHNFNRWLEQRCDPPYVFVSDNPAFDWQWINDGFWRTMGRNPFGHSARRIGDFYAGLCGNFRKSNDWKKLRITAHDHDPTHDALGNVEAFKRIMAGER